MEKKTLKLISWNVNGIRASYKKGLSDFISKEQPDILCLQEVKAMRDQLPSGITDVDGYDFYIHSAEKKGYSGVAVYSKLKPIKHGYTFGDEFSENEGRILYLKFETFTIFNIYFPNGGKSPEHFEYKLEFYNKARDYLSKLVETTNVILCGDINAAHTEIDLARPKGNEKSIGFLPVERDWITSFINAGFVDTFRIFNKEGGNYSWWDMKTRARDRNVGWRIDYFFINKKIENDVAEASIMTDVLGSDHCPILLKVSI